MSKAFAIKAHGSVEVMHGWGDYESPPMDGIWGRIEYPAVLNQKKVDRVGAFIKTIYMRSNMLTDY
jgi:hypothetical protein